MSVNVRNFERGQLLCHCGTHHGMTQSAKSARGRSVALPQQRLQDLPEFPAVGCEAANSLQHFSIGEWLKKVCLFPPSVFGGFKFFRTDAFAAAANHAHTASAQFRNFINHIRLKRRRELIGDIGDGGQAANS